MDLRGKVGRPPVPIDRKLIRDLWNAGLSFRQIAEKTGLGYETVRRAYFGPTSEPKARQQSAQLTSQRDKNDPSSAVTGNKLNKSDNP
jgi:hypothetical protein